MNLKRIRLTFISISLFLISSSALFSQNQLADIVANGEIKIGMTMNQPPFCMQSKKHELVGFEVDLAEILAQSMNVKLKIVQLPFSELLPALKEKKIDAIMSGMTITTVRNLEVSFVGPYVVSGKSVLSKTMPLTKIEEAKDLNRGGIKFVALEGSTSEIFIKSVAKSAPLTLTKNYDEAIKLIMAGEADALIADYPTCALFQIKYPDEDFNVLEKPLTLESIGMALPQNEPQLLNYMQNFYNSMLLSGFLDELQYHWFEDGSWLQKEEIDALLEWEE